MDILKSKRLDHLKYEIRGPVYDKALALQNQGYKITSLNIGNPAAFGFETPDEIVHDIIVNIRNAQGYVDSRGLFAARKAVMQYYQNLGVKNILIEDIYIGNGVSELISLVMTALLNTDDEVLIPSPDYPLWTTVAGLAGGKAVHYSCDEEKEWARIVSVKNVDDIIIVEVDEMPPPPKELEELAEQYLNPKNASGLTLDHKILILKGCRPPILTNC
jgi:alanine-synthesizing transaminase